MLEEFTITRKSIMTGKETTQVMRLRLDDYIRWQAGSNIQDCMPYLTPDQREFMMTGITAEEWDAAFKEEDDSHNL